jgi:hypothetical protein
MTDTKVIATVDVASAWGSKINWTQAVSGFAMVLTFATGGKLGMTIDQQAAVVTTIGVLTNIATWVMKTWFTKTITPASAAAPEVPTATVSAAPTPVSLVSKASAIVAILILGNFLLPPPQAFAQIKKPAINLPFDPLHLNDASPTAPLDNLTALLAKPFTDIANFIGADADGAVSLSTAIPNIQDGHGQQCWIAMKSFGDIIKAHPVPVTFHVINDYESLRLLGIATNNLCSNVHCTQVFADFTAMAQAASPTPLAIPSLHDLCTKVPQIAVVAPVTVPATPTTPATPAPVKTP